MAVILPPAVTPANRSHYRTMMPIVRNPKPMAMPLIRSRDENGGYDSSEHTPAQKSKRAPFTPLSADEPPDLVDESDDEDRAEETDEETLATHYKI